MVLGQSDVETFFPSLKFDARGSGYVDNEASADDTIDPSDTTADIEAQGRLDGYEVSFSEPVVTFGFVLSSGVDLFDSPESAQAFLQRQISDFRRLAGTEIEQGVTLTAFEEFEAPNIGSDAVSSRITASIVGFDKDITNHFVTWRRGPVVAVVIVVAFDNEDRSVTAGRLARRMDLPIDGVLAGKIFVTPVAEAPSGTAEERALKEGFDLSAMLLTLLDLPDGAVITEDGYVEESDAISRYGRGFKPEAQVIMIGSSDLVGIQAAVELFATPLDARGPVLVFRGLDPQVFGELAGPAFAESLGFVPENITFESLNLPPIGDASAGFLMKVTAGDLGVDSHLTFFSAGRVRAELIVVGTTGGVALEDTVALAELIVQRIQQNTP